MTSTKRLAHTMGRDQGGRRLPVHDPMMTPVAWNAPRYPSRSLERQPVQRELREPRRHLRIQVRQHHDDVVLPDTPRTLSAGERQLLDEWLDRLAAAKE